MTTTTHSPQSPAALALQGCELHALFLFLVVGILLLVRRQTQLVDSFGRFIVWALVGIVDGSSSGSIIICRRQQRRRDARLFDALGRRTFDSSRSTFAGRQQGCILLYGQLGADNGSRCALDGFRISLIGWLGVADAFICCCTDNRANVAISLPVPCSKIRSLESVAYTALCYWRAWRNCECDRIDETDTFDALGGTCVGTPIVLATGDWNEGAAVALDCSFGGEAIGLSGATCRCWISTNVHCRCNGRLPCRLQCRWFR